MKSSPFNSPKLLLILAVLCVVTFVVMRGCDSTPASLSTRLNTSTSLAATNFAPGAKLYRRSDNALWGTVLEQDASHQFPNGTVEPGVKVRNGFGADSADVWFPYTSLARIAYTK